MALIKTVAEIRAVIPHLSRLSDDANLPNVDKAGRMRIVPIIGKELYGDLNAKYKNNNLTDSEKELVANIQLPLAAYTLLDDLAFLQSTITDNGIRTPETANLKAAHRWEYKEIQNALTNYAADGVELLLEFLFSNKADWPMWTGSPEYKEINGFLIKTGTDFRKYYPLLQPLRTFWAMKPVIADVEENYLATALGRDLLAWVKLQEDIIITADGGEVDVLWFLKKAAAHLSIKHAADQMPVQFNEGGFTVLAAGGSADDPNTDGKAPASDSDMKKKITAADRDGQNYLAKACKYLVGIAAGMYGNDFGDDFTTAFDKSPLKPDPNKKPFTRGNGNRKFYAFR